LSVICKNNCNLMWIRVVNQRVIKFHNYVSLKMYWDKIEKHLNSKNYLKKKWFNSRKLI
jgi:hypothetical protein